MNIIYKDMVWDSNFFGKKVVQLIPRLLNSEGAEGHLKEMADEGVDLAYYYSNEALPKDYYSRYYDIFCVDEKIPLKKTLSIHDLHPDISPYTELIPEKKLVELAQLAGSHSRFKVDPNIPEEKFKELFKIWIEKSVKGEIASEVLVYRIKGEIVGFGTLKINGLEGQAPLFAVHPDYEGRGISFALMKALESRMAEKGCQYVLTSTQSSNLKALKVYERYGLEVQKKIYVYHLWLKKTF